MHPQILLQYLSKRLSFPPLLRAQLSQQQLKTNKHSQQLLKTKSLALDARLSFFWFLFWGITLLAPHFKGT